jgi:hypothetical protein
MSSGGVLVALVLLMIGGLVVATVVVVVRGGLGPGDPPASRPRVDPGGFPVLPRPRGVFERPAQRRSSRASRPVAARIAAEAHTARESRTARRMSPAVGGRPSPSGGRTSTRLP